MSIRESDALKLQEKIVDRQIAVRRNEYESALKQLFGRNIEDAKLKTYIANYFAFCNYSRKNAGWISFYKELDYLENYFLMEQTFFGDVFRLYKDLAFTDFSIPLFTIFPMIREAAINLVCSGDFAKVWISTYKEKDMIRIVVCHDISEESLQDPDFRVSNTYGFSLLKKRIEQCSGSLTREAAKDGLMENTLLLPAVKTTETEPIYVWFR